MEGKKVPMEYRYLGNTGIKVSVLGLGNMMTNYDQAGEDAQNEIVKVALDAGVNFFDTAEMYGFGEGERMLGRTIKKFELRRQDIVITNKIFVAGMPGTVGPNRVGLSRKHIIEGALDGLEKMDQEYVDVIYAHRPDLETPLEEQCRAFNWLIEHGKALYWGTSEWSPERLTKAIDLCDRKGWHRPVCDQSEYNCLVRTRFEEGLRPLYEDFKLGTTTWSPLAQGLLSGKYNGGDIPEDARFTSPFFKSLTWGRYMGTEEK